MKKHVIILGGGISGLSLRYFLTKQYPDLKITLLEKENRLGGLIESKQESGFFFEQGPRTFKASKSLELLKLIQELGIEQELLVADKEAAHRFIWKNKKLWKMHFFSPLVRKLYPDLLKEWKQEVFEGDETIYDFAKRRLGSYAADVFFDAMITGIYAGDIRKLSVLSCLPSLKNLELTHGSILRGMFEKKQKRVYPNGLRGSSLFTLRSGLFSLIKALEEKGRGEIRLNSPVQDIVHRDGKVYAEGMEADHAFCALSLQGAKHLTQNWDPIFSHFFSQLEAVSLTTVQLGFNESVLEQKGFGYLVPSCENESILGVVFDSAAFPEQNSQNKETRLTAMVKGMDTSQNQLERALAGIKKHLRVNEIPSWTKVISYPNAIPQFFVGHEERKRVFQTGISEKYPNISFLGNYLDGISINDCIQKARLIAGDRF